MRWRWIAGHTAPIVVATRPILERRLQGLRALPMR